MTALEMAREIFPDLSDEELDFILWNYTGFPCFFFSIETAEDELRKQLEDYKNCRPGNYMTYYNAFELRSELEDETINESAPVIIVDMHGVYMQPAHLFLRNGQPVIIVGMVGSYNFDSELRDDIAQVLRQMRDTRKAFPDTQQRLL